MVLPSTKSPEELGIRREHADVLDAGMRYLSTPIFRHQTDVESSCMTTLLKVLEKALEIDNEITEKPRAANR